MLFLCLSHIDTFPSYRSCWREPEGDARVGRGLGLNPLRRETERGDQAHDGTGDEYIPRQACFEPGVVGIDPLQGREQLAAQAGEVSLARTCTDLPPQGRQVSSGGI